ncbi:MAG: iron-containing alcohol dehydrogenase [Bacteroidales bacterium]|jgi:alcohol dehydrogenase YqhD (iron-dependent ADH family)|nr:iron-containing alcohol dehydrogenase [Bacteroidales bacterium]NLM93442.1 iron-containing alcohol dehydrogenase [Bacteroidales bacterium]
MENFRIYNPVELHFGAGVVKKLGSLASAYGNKALLVYGKGSVKRNGSYRETLQSLLDAGIEVVEFDGIKSNPIIEDVDAAADLGRKEGVSMIIAVGGGSVIDSAKIIALTIPVSHSGWEFLDGSEKPLKALPLIGVLTLAATGTEMNAAAVVQSDTHQKKIGYVHKLMYPRHSFLDPTYTCSVPENYTAYGIADLIAHALEAWFGEGEASLSDRFIIAIIKEALKYGPALMKDLENYALRARIMYAATCALNGMTVPGKKSQDWGVHNIGHTLGVKWDLAHGATLSIVYPAWLKLQQDRIQDRITELGSALFGCESVEDTIYKFEYFFKLIGCPITLSQAGIQCSKADKDDLHRIMQLNQVDGIHHKLNEEDYRFLIDHMA